MLRAIGSLVWACALYEEKLSRAVFWLECYRSDVILDLPGQRTGRLSRERDLKRLLEDPQIARVLGHDGVGFVSLAIDRIRNSLQFRDDLTHGHYLGDWGENFVFRARGKTFEKENSELVALTSTKIVRHGNKVLASAAILALIDGFFDNALNG